MKKRSLTRLLAPLAGLALMATSNAATIVDDFSGAFGGTTTVILDAGGSGSNTFNWDTGDGTARFVTSVYDGIEQTASTYSGFSLAIGQELQLDVASGAAGGSQDIGLYVGGVAPTTGVRSTYVNIYARNNGELYSRGFNETTELGLVAGGVLTFDKLFIARTDTNDFELGYYDGVTRTVLNTRTGMTNNDADFIGLYTDVRAAGTLRAVDNLVIIPEPATALLGALGMLGLLRRRRA